MNFIDTSWKIYFKQANLKNQWGEMGRRLEIWREKNISNYSHLGSTVWNQNKTLPNIGTNKNIK